MRSRRRQHQPERQHDADNEEAHHPVGAAEFLRAKILDHDGVGEGPDERSAALRVEKPEVHDAAVGFHRAAERSSVIIPASFD